MSQISELSPITQLDYFFVGEDQSFLWPIYDDDDITLINITTWTIQFKMSVGKGGTAVLTKSATLEDPQNGLCRVSFLAADTSALAARKYFYTLTRTNAGFVNVLAHGDAHLQAKVI